MKLSRVEELALIGRAQAGEVTAVHALFMAHDAKIRWLVRRLNCFDPEEDLVQASWEPFNVAVMNFDPARENRLWALAQKVLWHALSRQVTTRWNPLTSGSPTSGPEVSFNDEIDLQGLRWESSSAFPPDPEIQVVRDSSIQSGLEAVLIQLGPSGGVKHLVLCLLKEHVGWDFLWTDIVQLLSEEGPGPSPDWHFVLSNEFPHLVRILPVSWSATRFLFQRPPPLLNELALRKAYSRASRELRFYSDGRLPW